MKKGIAYEIYYALGILILASFSILSVFNDSKIFACIMCLGNLANAFFVIYALIDSYQQ